MAAENSLETVSIPDPRELDLVEKISLKLSLLCKENCPPHIRTRFQGIMVEPVQSTELTLLKSGVDGCCFLIPYQGTNVVAKRLARPSTDALIHEAAITCWVALFEPPCAVRPIFSEDRHLVFLDDGEHWYFLIEYIEGTTLEEWLESEPERWQVLLLFVNLAYTLRWFELNNLGHHDLHSKNVIIPADDSNWEPKIIDFGRSELKPKTLSDRHSFYRLLGEAYGYPDEDWLGNVPASLLPFAENIDYRGTHQSMEEICRELGTRLKLPTLESCPTKLIMGGSKLFIDTATLGGIHGLCFSTLADPSTSGLSSYQESAFPARPFSKDTWREACCASEE